MQNSSGIGNLGRGAHTAKELECDQFAFYPNINAEMILGTRIARGVPSLVLAPGPLRGRRSVCARANKIIERNR
jgi:hypothetical protein